MKCLNVFLTNLGKYNEGELVGEWIELPLSEEEIEVAEEIVYEGGYLRDAPKLLADYFDYEAFGRALEINDHFVQRENGGYIQIIR